MSSYRLQATLQGHSGDVKAVAFAPIGVVSASRDGSAKLLQSGSTLAEAGVFLNSIAADLATVFIGAQDGQIIATPATGEAIDRGGCTPAYFMGHTNNVCALDAGAGKLVSGSWDKTARIWNAADPGEQAIVLDGHTEAVWAVLLLGDSVITGSADKTIVRWSLDGRKLHTYTGHTDAVRGLAKVGNDRFASVSNDGTVRVWSINGPLLETLHGHTSFVYSVAYHESSGLLFSSGEDRTVRIWKGPKAVQTLTLPAVSLWSVAVDDDGTLAVGASDHTVRLFSADKTKWASESELKSFSDEVAASSLGEDQVGKIDESQLADPSVIEHPGREGQIALVKVRGVVEAHQFSAGFWTKVGQVTGTSSDGAKTTYNGRSYDYVFDVDIKDGEPALKLPFNNSDNVYIVAEKFVSDHDLPSTYVEDVVRFLIANTQSTRLGTANTTSAAPAPAAAAPSSSAHSSSNTGLLNYSTPLFLESFQKAGLVKAFSAGAATHNEKIDIESMLSSLPSSSQELLTVTLKAANTWGVTDMLPALDALRLAIPAAPQVPLAALITLLLSCIDAEVPKHTLLAIRGLSNLAARAADGQKNVARNRQVFSQALEMLQTFTTVSGPLGLAIATLLLNLAVQGFGGEIGPTAAWLSGKISDEEGRYRLALAIGVRARQEAGEIAALRRTVPWLKEGGEARFKDLAEVIVPLLK